VLSPKEYREQADQCIGWARSAVSDSERKLYRQLAVFWLENAVRLEPRATKLPEAAAVALPVISPTRRQRKRSGDQKGSPEKRIPQLKSAYQLAGQQPVRGQVVKSPASLPAR
jgi:hypothetical protein